MIYQCNEVEIDTLNFSLSRKGKTLAIEPKVFDVIAYLIANRDRLISRQEIFDKIWGGNVVCDTSLSNHIKNARYALGDNGRQQRVIKTIYGRGYQFIADTETLFNHEQCSDKKPSIFSNQKQPKDFRGSFVDTLLLPDNISTPLSYKLNNLANYSGSSIKYEQSYCEEKSIAVLAFEDFSPELNLDYFTSGISVEILNLLVKISNVRVISRTSSFSYKSKKINIIKIGQELHATHILEGSVRKSCNNIRISIQLIEVLNGFCLWAKTYKDNMRDIFKIQDEIASDVKKQLTIKFI